MAFNIARVAIRLIANTQEFQRGMRQAGRRLETFKRTAGRFGRALGVGITSSVTAATVRAVGFNRAMLDMSRQLARPVEELQAMAFAFREAGVSQANYLIAIRRVNRLTSEAVNGNRTLQRAFAELNIDFEKFGNLKLAEQMRVLAVRYRELEGNTERLAIFNKLLQQEGLAALQVIGQGPAFIDRWTRAAAKMGVANEKTATGLEQLRRVGGRALDHLAAKVGQAINFFLPKEAGNVAIARANQASSEKAIAEALKVQLDAKKRTAILAATEQKQKTGRNFGARQINRSAEFLSFRRKGNPQEIRSKQIDTTNNLLRDIRSFMRNNTTGNTVTFSG